MKSNHKSRLTNHAFLPVLDQPLVFLDLETTGAHPAYDRITEVGLIEVDRGRRVGEWSTLVNPQESIPPAIQALTGITNEKRGRRMGRKAEERG